MKLLFTLLLISTTSVLVSNLFAQQLKPTDKTALVTFEVKDKNLAPVSNALINIKIPKKSKEIQRMCDKEGLFSMLLPIGEVYLLSIEGGNMEVKFDMPNLGNQSYTVPLSYAPLGEAIEDAGNMVTIQMFVVNDKEEPIEELVTLKNLKTGEIYEGMTNERGLKSFQLTNDAAYTVSFEGAPEYKLFTLDQTANLTQQQKIIFQRHEDWTLYPNYKSGLLNFNFEDLDAYSNEETFTITIQETGEVYTCKTNKEGFGQVLIPLGGSYTFKTPFNSDFPLIQAPKKFFIHDIKHKSLSAKARGVRDAWLEKDRLYRDSITKAWEIEALELKKERQAAFLAGKSSIYGCLAMNETPALIEKDLLKLADHYKTLLEKDPAIFVKHQKLVLAVLNRLKGSWQNKIVVTDITGSMSPYYQQVLIWHALNLIKGGETKYVFFNDGDNHPDGPIGASGGLYHCQGKIEDLNTIIATMQKGTRAGSGGMGPENDIEALLGAVAQRKKGEELILIADGLCKVRDIQLIQKLKIPVRIIICGGAYSRRRAINSQYMRIARKTKGSVHTMEEDITNLGDLVNGGTVKLNGENYEFQDGEFIHRPR
ncbi:MAG: Unknown protein [uncultured Aureispira sp.]|uniref:VWFA domain-containing protein n=1 Tax=uncultured Aureispira sp. TaxID=1331704 RepID=A0A6S6UCW9_9BACT|nr:MAG: Unknown protein [uncultured Aureispira sp.]